MRFHTITFKTLSDLFRIKRSIVFIITMMILPVIISIILNTTFNLTSMTLANQVQTVTMFYIMLVFVWIAGLPLVLFTSVTCGDFITKEEQDGTLLLLVSKPVRKYEIILGKYFAFIINILLLEIIAIIITPLILYWLLPIDPYVLDTMAGLIPSLIFYAMFIAITFGALATALSCISRSRFKTIILLVALTLGIFLGFMIFRGIMISVDVYDPYVVWGDVNYHMGNSYMYFLDSSDYRITPTSQALLGTLTGTYSAVDMSMLYDQDIGAMYPSIPRTKYVTQMASMLGWLAFTMLMLIVGILRFQKREIK